MSDDQAELFKDLSIDNHWFHVLRGGIRRGAIAKMGPTAWSVYCVLKSYTDLGSGKSFPGQPKIADLTGLSVDTVARATDKLIELGLVRKTKVGRHNEYTLVEEVSIMRRDEAGDMVDVGSAQRDYVPRNFQPMIAELQALVKGGDLEKLRASGITLNINLITGEHAVVTINQAPGDVTRTTPRTGADGRGGAGVVDVQARVRALDDMETPAPPPPVGGR